MTLHFSHMGFTDGLTFIVITSYECLDGPVVVASSSQAAHPSLPAFAESSFAPLLLLSKANPPSAGLRFGAAYGRLFEGKASN